MALRGFIPAADLKFQLAKATFMGARSLALRTEALAIALCPVAQGGAGPSVGAGTLKRSHFRKESLDAVFGWRMQIGANTSYAYFVHQGTHPHPIDAKPGGTLHFYWAKAGGYVFLQHVNHPGTRPQPWLWQAASTIIRSTFI